MRFQRILLPAIGGFPAPFAGKILVVMSWMIVELVGRNSPCSAFPASRIGSSIDVIVSPPLSSA